MDEPDAGKRNVDSTRGAMEGESQGAADGAEEGKAPSEVWSTGRREVGAQEDTDSCPGRCTHVT